MKDDLFDAVCTADRRIVLRALRDEQPIDFDSLATVVASDPDDRTRAAIRLRHAHLPKLDAYGVIDWGRETDSVRQGPRFDETDRLLAAFENEADGPPLR